MQVGYAGGLAFVDEVGVPATRSAGVAEVGEFFGGLEGGPDDL